MRLAKRVSISASVIARRREDAALRRRAGKFGHREKRLARQRRGGIDIGAAAVRQQKRARSTAAIFGDALGIGEGEQRADTQFLIFLRTVARGGELGRSFSPTLRHAARIAPAMRTVAMQRVETLAQIDIVAAEAALADQRGEFGGL